MTRRDCGRAGQLARAGVTGREAEVLAAVAARLRNREIAEALHISVRTVETHVAALLRKLDVADRAGLVEVGLQARGTASVDHPLPSPLTSLVGREQDTREVTALLGAHRLVTLTGPAGAGKTRLALHVAAEQGDYFPDGARLADLAPIGADLVADTVARALGVVAQQAGQLRGTLREVAGEMHGLLLVDNCEHVVDDVAELVADLLTAGGQLRILATSREPLGVPGEVAYQVSTLAVPTAGASPFAATAGGFDAVRLFVDRAATASPGFTLTDANSMAVAVLCRRLDGLPLAIELAAARARTFGPVELVQHLDQRFELLSGGARTVLPRHRTLRNAIDWSYQLLDDDERALFDRLGVFTAEFDFEAAQAVGGEAGPGRAAVIGLLPRLVDKSLVCVGQGGPRRYRLLETLRAYAAEQLVASGAEDKTRLRHANHYLTLAEHAGAGLRGPDQRAWLDRLNTEQPNLRAAMAHCVSGGDIESTWHWIATLQRFWDASGQRNEAHEWIHRALAMGNPPATPAAVEGLAAASAAMQPADARASFDLAQRAAQLAVTFDTLTRAQVARAVGMGAMWVQPELVLDSLHEALALLDDDQPWERAATMMGLAQAVPELTDALHWGQRSAELFRQVGDQMYAANALFILAQRAMRAGIADDNVHTWLAESQALAVATGNEEDQVHATVGFGQLAWLRNDRAVAAELMQECLPTLRRLGDRRCTGRALHVLGEWAHAQGQLGRAEELLRAGVEMVELAGQSTVLVLTLDALTCVFHDQNRPRPAALLLGVASTARESDSRHVPPSQPRDGLRPSLMEQLGTAAFDAAYAEGRRLSATEALQLAGAEQRDPSPVGVPSAAD